MYLGVPEHLARSRSAMRSPPASRFARPKSVTSRVPWESTRTFEGFKSRCKTPRWCGVVHGPDHGDHALDFLRGSSLRGCFASDVPSTNFIEKYCWPSCSPTS